MSSLAAVKLSDWLDDESLMVGCRGSVTWLVEGSSLVSAGWPMGYGSSLLSSPAHRIRSDDIPVSLLISTPAQGWNKSTRHQK